MAIYSKDGRLMFPLRERKRKAVKHNENKIRYIISEAYCPEGCNIVDAEHKIQGYPGLKLRFKRPQMEGEMVISAIEGDFEKIVLSGKLIDGVKDELFCPHCDAPFKKLLNCNCMPDADMIVIGLTPKLDFNDSISFCNVTGCSNGTFIHSGEVIRHVRLGHGF
jgi:hypothetical protein